MQHLVKLTKRHDFTLVSNDWEPHYIGSVQNGEKEVKDWSEKATVFHFLFQEVNSETLCRNMEGDCLPKKERVIIERKVHHVVMLSIVVSSKVVLAFIVNLLHHGYD